jgi:hypothetical protein
MFRSKDQLPAVPPADGHTTETCSGYWIKYSKQCCVRRKPWTWVFQMILCCACYENVTFEGVQRHYCKRWVFFHFTSHVTEVRNGKGEKLQGKPWRLHAARVTQIMVWQHEQRGHCVTPPPVLLRQYVMAEGVNELRNENSCFVTRGKSSDWATKTHITRYQTDYYTKSLYHK